jgi:glycosyltransferase involved in cell wall biosynthesis
MSDITLSVVIPSYKDPILHKTIDSLLTTSELGEKLEIVVVLDGYWPEQMIVEDPRIRIIHVGKNQGMRESINTGVRMARGKYIMRTDEHCKFAPGFDKIMTDGMQDDCIFTARRFYLDPIKWECLDIPPVDYEKLAVRLDDKGQPYKFEGQVWRKRTKERKDVMIDETMAMQGSMWMMSRRWWRKVIKRLETKGYGVMYQDSHEMQFKTWKAGGKLMVNKNTWFAHKHVSFPRTHNYRRSDYEPCLKYALDTWIDYYEKEVVPKWRT